MNAPRIRAVILDGPVDDSVLATIRAAIANPRLVVVHAKPRVEEIRDLVALEMGVSGAEITSEGRSPRGRGQRARRAIVWLAYRLTGKGRKVIGDVIARDANTVFHALRRAEEMRDSDPAFRRLTDRLHEHFTGERP